MPMRLPAMSSALAMAVFFGPKTTMARAPLGLQKATVLARSKVMEIEDRVRSQRPASKDGMRWVETTCCSSSSTPRSLASWRQLATSTPSGLPSLPMTPKGGELVSQAMRITFSFNILSSVVTPPVCAEAEDVSAASVIPARPDPAIRPRRSMMRFPIFVVAGIIGANMRGWQAWAGRINVPATKSATEDAMTITIEPVNAERPGFVGSVTGVDLRATLSPGDHAAIEAGMDRYAVLVFRGQPLDDAQQLAFSRNFGTLETATGDLAQGEQRRLAMEMNDISNVDKEGRVLARDDRRRLFGLGNMLWHSDSSFKAVPAKYSLLSARVIPPHGGNTEFADMRSAWDALDAETRALVAGLVCEHSQIYSRGVLGFTFTEEERIRFAPVLQSLVRVHPVTGRQSLFLSSHAGGIEGMPLPEARALLRDLSEHATQREHVHAHVWQADDLVIWDNRVTMHRARRYDPAERRDLRRTTVACEEATAQQKAA